MTETYTEFCIRIGALNKLPLAAQFDSGEKQPEEIIESANNLHHSIQKNYHSPKECSLDYVI